MLKSAKCNEREAAECIIRVLYKKQEEAFPSFALEKSLIADKEKKMNAVQVEAMFSEAGLCKSNSRIVFQRRNQFFRKEKFESELKRRA